MRAPVAEHSARAIAGSINIVLREELVKRENDVLARAGLGGSAWLAAGNLGAEESTRCGSGSTPTTGRWRPQRPDRDLPRNVATSDHRRRLNATGVRPRWRSEQARPEATAAPTALNLNAAQLNWRMDGGNNFEKNNLLLIYPFMNGDIRARSQGAGPASTVLEQSLGAQPPIAIRRHPLGAMSRTTRYVRA